MHFSSFVGKAGKVVFVFCEDKKHLDIDGKI